MVKQQRRIQARPPTVSLKTLTLTRKVFRQLTALTEQEFRRATRRKDAIVGWVHGAAVGEDAKTWLVVQTAPGVYAKYDTISYFRRQYPQLFV